ncbi:Uncharacterised protein [Yersinia frederiksenii]|nr:Uncharacterised protein [Yersinia frederiksenii]
MDACGVLGLLGACEGQKITAKQLKATLALNQLAVMHCKNLRYYLNHRNTLIYGGTF